MLADRFWRSHRETGKSIQCRRSKQQSEVEFGARRKEKMGLPLGIGSPGRRVSIAGVVFTPTRGVIHPASLSEAGGNELQKVTSKPLPPHLPISAVRHLKHAHAVLQCTAHANAENSWEAIKYFFMLRLAFSETRWGAPKSDC